MIEVVLIASATLGIVLYLQARFSAREIRRNRDRSLGSLVILERSER
ncbi:hypothetical protein [Phaeobacter gallaeciensis]|uniref:Uncharacterized protein n=1 Tax=Phaeobacter gallaeciensis TaxID=60890 RepID=A0AAD0EC01_9RHOB|nr:hypothetical protein [Phaeobacter gallaeciensis]AHD08716.1 hypothetical protein Gal_00942 [Phaeobacter gallaeciensis DSM 26640]ATE91982.1 hypothetical protein PhaeoP11_00937 [Phaeobacter gallaeciensis]ATE98194.1 hypothetical protein PhaeoP73_02907 [Phaeobacter gallaeciensis]ATF00598.1 hypothetical protein PhaeoP75_00938 [Phaeobacter gallaeciensis]ATF05029.1 hypothetical protein PhaeoP63_00937 [Phaeobacter gallaeciensis]